MRCKTCDYPLWQIRDRRCPECGAPFVPSDFEFVLNSVRFCCPHCAQDYYGTGVQGHLVPRAFECVSCARPIDMDEMVLLPTEGVLEAQTKVEINPWLERGRRGFFGAFFATIGRSMGGPGRLIQATPTESSLGAALWYATLCNGFFLSIGLAGPALLMVVIGLAGGMGGGGVGPGLGFAGFALGWLAGTVLGAYIWAGVIHGLLLMTGPVAGGYRRTLQCVLYSSGTNLGTAVPCISIYLFWLGQIWWTVAATIMVKDGQRVSGGRAAFATITPVLLGFLLAIAGLGLLIYNAVTTTRTAIAAAAANTPAGQNVQGEPGRIAQLAAAIQVHAAEQGGPPDHAIELLDTQRVWVGLFLHNDAPYDQRAAEARVQGMTLRDLGMADAGTTDIIIRGAVRNLPGNVVAHRVGDSVFTFHGIDFESADPRLWTVVSAPEPGSAAPSYLTWTIIGLADGNTKTIPAARLAAELAAQNRIRAENGLPPLPDPAAVLSDQPATADWPRDEPDGTP